MWNCACCAAISEKPPKKCPTCGVEGAYEKVRGPRPLSEDTPDDFERVSVGDREMDRFLDGGFPLTLTALFHGAPGAGKSTLLYRWATAIGPTLAVCPEMPRDLVYKIASRGGADLSRLFYRREVAGYARDALLCDAQVIVLDSLSESGTTPLFLLEELRTWAERNRRIVWFIAHESKKGRRALGPAGFEYKPDAVFRFSKAREDYARVRCKKSRFCPSGTIVVPVLPGAPRAIPKVER